MAGEWEQRLRSFAEMGSAWDVPTKSELGERLEVLRKVVSKISDDPGLVGASGDAATQAFKSTAVQLDHQIDYVTQNLPAALDGANATREKAKNLLASLPDGQLSGSQEAIVRTAAVGMTLVLGPFSFVAGDGAVGLINGVLQSQREDAARDALSEVSRDLDAVNLGEPPEFRGSMYKRPEPKPVPQPSPTHWDHVSDAERGAGAFQTYPGHDQPVLSSLPGGVASANPDAGSWESGSGSHRSGSGGGRVIDLGNPGGQAPTADGAIGGISTMPGAGQTPGAGWGGAGSAAGLGSGLSAGLVAGAGGAAAVSRLSRGVSAGEVGAAGRGVAGTGGLLGKTGAGAGSGLGVRSGVGGLGAPGGGAPGSADARGAGMRAGMTGPSSGAGAGAGAGAGSAGTGGGGAAGGRGTGGMGAGGAGSRSDRRGQGHGLGGPIAPRMDDDEEIGPRSHNAAAGSRDDT